MPADSPPPDFSVRRFRPDDAPGVVRLIRDVYGDSYYPTDLYDPARVVELNANGRLASVVAIDGADEVVGHYAFERPTGAAVAEASDAIVAVPARHHHLLEEMRAPLRAEAIRVGLAGLVGYPVTNHLFSQKADERIGARPCGVAPGLWPKSFHNMPAPLPQRMSFVVYFKYLRAVPETTHVATSHDAMLAKIAGQWSVQVRPCAPAPGVGPSELTVIEEKPVETGTIRVVKAGADAGAAVRQARQKLTAGGAKAIALELPLAQPATAALCRVAEAEGFFFTGLGPAFAADGDALCMQWLGESQLDWSLIEIESPFAKELLAYAQSERARVGRI